MENAIFVFGIFAVASLLHYARKGRRKAECLIISGGWLALMGVLAIW